MEFRRLGNSGAIVTAWCLGTMTFGSEADEATSFAIMDAYIKAGGNFLDTADVYSNGASEEIVGEALGGKRKNDVLIASKARMRIGKGPNDEGLSRHHLIRECEKSLKRLRTDVIDIYFLHEWDGVTPLEETMAALDTLVAQGKIRYIGCSNYSGWHVMKALGISDSQHQPRFVTQQIHYTLEAREAEYELLPISVDQGLGVLVWSPLAGGLLSGKYRRDSPTARQLAGWSEPPIRDEDRLWRIVDVLVDIGAARGVSAAQVALAWLLGRPAVSSLVIGARNETQLKDNLAAAALALTAEERDRLDAVSRPPVLYPYWHQQFTAKDRFGPADLVLDRSVI